MSVLNQKVLVINKGWQAVGERDVATTMCDMMRGAVTAIDMEFMAPVKWDDWLKLSIRDGDQFLRTIHGPVRVPTVVCASTYAGMPKKRPRFNSKNVGRRDQFVCAYTGKHDPQGNVDHVVPRSRGGANTWDNTVWSSREVNSKKADRTPQEAGLKLRKKPQAPKALPVCRLIQVAHPDWEMFIGKS